MRIAYVCADAGVPIFGRKGCSVHVQEMVRALQRRGASVDLFAARVDDPPPPGLESLRVYRIPAVGDGEPPSHTAAMAALNRELAAALDGAGPYDLVYERYSLWSFAGMEHARAAATPAPPGTFTVGFVGSMKRWHGLPVLIEAFARLQTRVAASRLLLVGAGPEDAAVRAALTDRGLALASCLTGAVAPGEVPAFLTSMDAAIAPYPESRGFYFSPLKVYEYMAAGRAVVASGVGQVAAVIRHDVNGLLCPPGDSVALAAALERLQREPELGARLGRAARVCALQRHSWEGVAERVLEVADTARRAGRRDGRREQPRARVEA